MDFDLEADLWEQSEFIKTECEPPETIKDWRKRAKMQKSIYDVCPEELSVHQENVESPVVYVRGRPIKLNQDTQPGIIEFHKKTQESIREVCGVGHSNEASESYIKLLQKESVNTKPVNDDAYSDADFPTHETSKENIEYSLTEC